MRKVQGMLGLSVVLLTLFCGTVAAEPVAKVSKYVVKVPEKFYVQYNGASQTEFASGFVTGFGSGIYLKSMNKDGSIDFYGITDRGPNGDGPWYHNGQKIESAKYFLAPYFQPEIGVIRVQGGKAEVINTIGLKTGKGQAVTGLPITPGKVGATNEIALGENLANLGYDDSGLDTEGIAVDGQGNFWVCDEYGPFIIQFDKRGNLLKKFAPGNGLPEVLKNRIPNRGFEGVTVTPKGMVYGIVQSPLDIEGATGKTARFSRIVRLDPKTGKTAMFAYPIDLEAYKKPKDAKIGDIYAVTETKFLVTEQGTGKDKQLRNLVLSKA